VTAENSIADEENEAAIKKGKYVKLSIKDRGVGIPEEHLSRIFDPYFSTKQKGSGLGLATTYSIVNRHEGFIDVESKPGVGTTLHIYLPASDKKPEKNKKETGKKKYISGKGNILFMDDDENIRKFMKSMIERLGYDVELAKDGEETMALYAKAMEEGKPFNAVIMDLTVPGGMGGKETIKELLKIDPNVTAIVSSGYSNDPVMAEYQNYGFKGVMAKPYKMKELSELLDRIINK